MATRQYLFRFKIINKMGQTGYSSKPYGQSNILSVNGASTETLDIKEILGIAKYIRFLVIRVLERIVVFEAEQRDTHRG